MNYDSLFSFQFHDKFKADEYAEIINKYSSLPESYVSFLKKYNKITTVQEIKKIHVGGDDCRISAFFGCKEILEENEFNDPEDFPEQLLKIGVDAFGDYLCIALKGETEGQIFWFTPFNPPEEEPIENVIESYGNIYKLFDSFTELMDYLV